MVTLLNTRDPLALFRKMYAEHVTAPIAASHTNIRQQHLKADLATINAQCATFAGHPAIPGALVLLAPGARDQALGDGVVVVGRDRQQRDRLDSGAREIRVLPDQIHLGTGGPAGG